MLADFFKKLSTDAKRGVIAMSSLVVLVALLLIIFLVIVPATKPKGKAKAGPTLGQNQARQTTAQSQYKRDRATADGQKTAQSQYKRGRANAVVGTEAYGMTHEQQCAECTPVMDDFQVMKVEGTDYYRVYNSYNPDTDNYVTCRTPWSGLEKSDPRYRGDVSNCDDMCGPNRCSDAEMEAVRDNAKSLKFTKNGLPIGVL